MSDKSERSRRTGTHKKDAAQTAEEPESAGRAEGGSEAEVEEPAVVVPAMQYEELREEAEKSVDRETYLRALADFDNYKKRVKRDVADTIFETEKRLVLALLPVFDNLERALAPAEETGDLEGFIEGVKLLEKSFLETLRGQGIVPVDATGAKFDPAYHQALLKEDTNEHPHHTVLEEYQKGFLLNGRLVRPAVVKVAVQGTEGTSQLSESLENEESQSESDERESE